MVVFKIGRFINKPDERNLVNSYIDSYVGGTSTYAKYIDSVPNFVTYYSKDFNHSTENNSVGSVKEIVGLESPIRYNKIEDFPLYSVEEMSPSLSMEDIGGITSMMEGDAIIIPDTIIPQPEDLFIFSYHETDEDHLKVFRITNVAQSSVDSNTYYRISYISYPYDIDILNQRMVSDEYNLIYNNIGTDQKTILLNRVYLTSSKLENVMTELSEVYVEDYFDNKTNTFLFSNELYNFYDPCLHHFINNNKLFITDQSIMKNIYVSDLNTLSKREYWSSPFYYIENNAEIPITAKMPFRMLDTHMRESIFALYRDNYRRITFYKSTINNDLTEQNSVFGNDINTLMDEYSSTNTIPEVSSIFEKIIILYVKNIDELDITIFSELFSELLYTDIDLSLRNYILIPIILYIIEQVIKSTLS